MPKSYSAEHTFARDEGEPQRLWAELRAMAEELSGRLIASGLAGTTVGVKLRYPDAEVLAFEPAPESVAVLRQNIGLHHLDGVLVNEIALGAVRERAAPFTYYPAIPANSTRYPQEKELQKSVMARTYTAKAVERLHTGRQITVAVDRLSRFLPTDRPVDLLKVDVEGGELDVLLGIDPPHWPLIRQVILEVHDFNGRLAAICDLLSSHGLESSVGPAPLIDPEILSYVVHAVRV